MAKSVMCRVEVKPLDCELTPVGGLALVGHWLKALTVPWAKLDGVLTVRGRVGKRDMVRTLGHWRSARVAAWLRQHERQDERKISRD